MKELTVKIELTQITIINCKVQTGDWDTNNL